jgi:microcystin-dependent protein
MANLNLNGCSSLTTISYIGNLLGQGTIDLRNSGIAAHTTSLNAFYTNCITTTSSGTILVGASGASATDSIATNKGWTINRSD